MNSRTFVWPSDLEEVIDLANTRLTERREIVEGVLRHRRTAYEARIKEDQISLELFKKKDPPVLGIDEMVPAVEELDELMERIRVSLDRIKVNLIVQFLFTNELLILEGR